MKNLTALDTVLSESLIGEPLFAEKLLQIPMPNEMENSPSTLDSHPRNQSVHSVVFLSGGRSSSKQ